MGRQILLSYGRANSHTGSLLEASFLCKTRKGRKISLSSSVAARHSKGQSSSTALSSQENVLVNGAGWVEAPERDTRTHVEESCPLTQLKTKA